jgi:hypothetical protein
VTTDQPLASGRCVNEPELTTSTPRQVTDITHIDPRGWIYLAAVWTCSRGALSAGPWIRTSTARSPSTPWAWP